MSTLDSHFTFLQKRRVLVLLTLQAGADTIPNV